ncbi:MAG: hypothetical protein DRJ32_06985 [Thermoprotei archaeon]|nr:MAG: hypothetical protein DRJ32_06985 [Thermoprotei archaeon]
MVVWGFYISIEPREYYVLTMEGNFIGKLHSILNMDREYAIGQVIGEFEERRKRKLRKSSKSRGAE